MSTIISCDKGGGRIVAKRANVVAPLSLQFENDNIATYGLVLAFDMEQGVAAQFQNAFNDTIFITPFGDIAGNASLTFLMNKECSGSGAVDRLGLIGKYLSKRLRPFSGSTTPIKIAIGSYAFRAYIVGFKMTATSSETPTVQGTLLLKVWPQ